MSSFDPSAGVRYILPAITAAALLFIAPVTWATSWIGDVDEYWVKAGNWSGGVPNTGTDATLINRATEPAVLEIVRLDGYSGDVNWLEARSETSLRITNGGTLDATFVRLQHDDFFELPTSLVISGADSSLTTGSMFVCQLHDISDAWDSGRVALTVEDGGELVINDTGLMVGWDDNCESEVTIRGEGSLLDYSEANGADFGFSPGADTELNVSGGAIVRAASHLDVGDDDNTTNVTIGGTTGSGYREPGILSVSPDRNVRGASSASLIFEHDQPDHVFANEDGDPVGMSGSHDVYQRGPGTTRLAADSTDFIGKLIVENGTLIVDATYWSADTFVEFGGTLKSQETVDSLTVEGTVKPAGDSIGKLRASNNYA